MERVYGLIKTTLVDYPGEVAATVFVPGCNLRCPYCHNPELVYGRAGETSVTETELFDFLRKRHTVLGGVCISGGEPLSGESIFSLVRAVKEIGLQVKVDTNGTFPDRLERLMDDPGIDFISMDIKTAPEMYGLLFPVSEEGRIGPNVKESIRIISHATIPHQFRTTVVPGIIGPGDIAAVCENLPVGETLVLQQFRPMVTLDSAFRNVEPYSADVLHAMCRLVTECGIQCRIIGITEARPPADSDAPVAMGVLPSPRSDIPVFRGLFAHSAAGGPGVGPEREPLNP